MKKRIAFKMKLLPGNKQEYAKRHEEIWPELAKLLSEEGISTYSIFMDPDSDYLFAYQQVSDNEEISKLAFQPIMKKWWEYMADIMETNNDKSPQIWSLTEVFYLE